MGKSILQRGTPESSQLIKAAQDGRRFRVCIDGRTVECFDIERDAKAFLRKLKLGSCENGYLDEIDSKGNHVQSIYQKLCTRGPLLECF